MIKIDVDYIDVGDDFAIRNRHYRTLTTSIMPISDGFVFLLPVRSKKATYNRWGNPDYAYSSRVMFVSSSGAIHDMTPKDSIDCELGFIGNTTHIWSLVADKDKTARQPSPHKTYCPNGHDWSLYKLDETNKHVNVGKPKKFVVKSELCSKMFLGHNRILVCGSCMRKTATKTLVTMMFGEIKVGVKQLLIGSIEAGFPIVENKIMQFDEEVLDCAVSKDGQTGCISVHQKSKSGDESGCGFELIILDL